MSAKQLFLIDGHALCYRSFFAIRELQNSRGESTNAVYGFVNTLRKILREYDPHYLAVCFDSKEKTLREKQYAEYKIQRPKMPEGLSEQIPIIKKVIQAFHIPLFEIPGYEADDIIATLSVQASEKKTGVVIVSEDKDMFQLADPRIRFFSIRKDKILEQKDIEEKLGFSPKYMADFLSLAGDKADNIPGVRGVGDVTARQLILQFGDLDGIYKNLKKIEKSSVREKLEAHQEEAKLSRELALLERDVPLDFDLTECEISDPDHEKLVQLFNDLEFKKLALEYSKAPAADEVEVTVEELSSSADVKKFAKTLPKKGPVVFYLDQPEDSLFSICYVSLGKEKIYSFPLEQLKELKNIWEEKALTKVVHNSKQWYKLLFSYDISPQGMIFDMMMVGYLLNPSRSQYRPSELAWIYLKEAAPDQVSGAQEASFAWSLYPVLEKRLKDEKLDELYHQMELPLAYVLARMENEGVTIDTEHLSVLSKDCQKKIKVLVKNLTDLSGEEINLNSPKQLSKILFEKLKLPVIKKTKTGYSTDEGVLTKLAESHDYPAGVLTYRQLTKLTSTYIDALPRMIDAKTKKIHAEFNQIGTETGRLSSRAPNLQNIPIRTELGRKIRRGFIPSTKSRLLVSADYSQVELRILAHLSQDEALKKAFLEDEDVHRYTASLIFEVDVKDVDYHMRDTAKRVNFGIVYGMSGFGLSKDLKITQAEAQDFIDRYFMRYPDVKKFMDDQIAQCEKKGYVLTLCNRRRYIPEINSRNNAVKQFAQRQAINTPVQGSAADLMKLAMIAIQTDMEKKKLESRMIITVHDELVFDCVKKEKDALIDLVKDKMEHVFDLDVPLKVDVKTGANWLDMKEVK